MIDFTLHQIKTPLYFKNYIPILSSDPREKGTNRYSLALRLIKGKTFRDKWLQSIHALGSCTVFFSEIKLDVVNDVSFNWN